MFYPNSSFFKYDANRKVRNFNVLSKFPVPSGDPESEDLYLVLNRIFMMENA